MWAFTVANRSSALACAIVLGTLTSASAEVQKRWKYVVPSEGEAMERPPWRALALSRECPDDVSQEVTYQGDGQYYAQFRYGSTDSVKIVVVVDEHSSGESRLYVDADRNRTIEPADLVAVTGKLWRITLEAAVAREDPSDSSEQLTAVFRLGKVIRVLSVATAGYLERRVEIDGRSVTARRVDADSNGRFADVQDRFWLDLNDDGRWDPLSERFLVRPVLELPSGRYAVAADMFGKSLAFKKLEGTGKLVLAAAPQTEGARVVDIAATLVGRDGATFALKGNGSQVTAPVGQYRLHSLVVAARQSDEAPPWEFIFTHPGDRDYRWFDLPPNSTMEINPLDRLILEVEGVGDSCRPGQSVSVQPRVYTGDGLLINACTLYAAGRSSGSDASHASVVLSSSDGQPLSSASSGFS